MFKAILNIVLLPLKLLVAVTKWLGLRRLSLLAAGAVAALLATPSTGEIGRAHV